MAKITGEDILKIALANPDVIVPPEALETGKTKAGKSKYGNVRCEFDNLKFDSKAELRRYGELRLLELSGTISNLRTQPVYELPSGVKYKGDFEYVENGQVTCEDVKGGTATMTQLFRVKWKQVKDRYPAIKFVLIGAK